MRIVIQRVIKAQVEIEHELTGKIGQGLMILLGIEEEDSDMDVEWLAAKVIGMRIFSDENGKMNRDILEADGEILVVSQFTLHASTKKGNRPSFIRAARPEKAIPLYHAFCDALSKGLMKPVATGKFGAMMKVSLTNDGPVTIFMDSKDRE